MHFISSSKDTNSSTVIIPSHATIEYTLGEREIADRLYHDLKNNLYDSWNKTSFDKKLIIVLGMLISNNENIQFLQHLWSIFLTKKMDIQNTYLISNILSLLNCLGFDFIGENGNFAGITLEGADFSGALLSNANFNGSILNHVNLTHAFMQGMQCTNADMRTVKFNEFPTHYYKNSAKVICFNKNGSYMAVAVGDAIILYTLSANEQKEMTTLQGHTSTIHSGVLNDEGTQLYSCGEDRKILVWDLKTKKYQVFARGDYPYKCLAIHQDSNILVSSKSNGDVEVRDLATTHLIGLLKGHSESVNTLAFTTAGHELATGDDDGKVMIWNIAKRKLLSEVNQRFSAVKYVTFSPDNNLLAIATNKLYLLNVQDLSNPGELSLLETRIEKSYKSDNTVYTCVSFNRSGKKIVAGNSDGRVHIWNMSHRNEMISLIRHFARINSIAISADDKYLVTASDDKTVRQWRADIGYDLAEDTGFIGTIVQGTFDKNGKPIVVIAGHNGIYQYNIFDKKIISFVKDTVGKVISVGYCPLTNVIAFGGERKAVYLLSQSDQLQQLIAQTSGSLDLDVYCVTFNQDGKILGIADKNKVNLWDISTLKEIDPLQLPASQRYTIYTLAFSADSTLIVTGGSSGNLNIWDFKSRMPVKKLTGHTDDVYAVCFSPDGKLISSAGKDKTIRIWDINSATQIALLRKHVGTVATIAFSPDSNLIASGSNDRSVLIWDIKSKELIADLGGHWGLINTINFSQDGKYLLVSCGDYGAFLWTHFGNIKEWYLMKRMTNDSYLYAQGAQFKGTKMSFANQKLLEQYGAKIEISLIENSNSSLLLSPPALKSNTSSEPESAVLTDAVDCKDDRDDVSNEFKPK